MAIVNIAEAIVRRSFYSDKGWEVAEQFKTRDGKDGEKKYTLFFDEPQSFQIGSKVKVSGLLSVKARIWVRDDAEDTAVADIVLNSPRVEVLGGGDSGGFGPDDDSPF